MSAWEWQHRAGTLSDECQHSSYSLPARQEANRQTAGSSQAWRGLLDRVQTSREHLSATSQNSCSLNSSSLHNLFFKKLPFQNLMSHYTVKCPASQYIVIHHTLCSPFVSSLLIWRENIQFITMCFLSFSPFLRICLLFAYRTYLYDSNTVSPSLYQCRY